MTGQKGLLIYSGLLLVLFLSLQRVPATHFVRFFGDINPTILFLMLAVLSFVAFSYLRRYNLLISSNQIRKGVWIAIVLAVLFFTIVLTADLQWGFPEDINVAFPHALSFYPVIGIMAEILLHLLPVSLLLVFLNLFDGPKFRRDLRINLAISLVALLEAYYQAYHSYLDDPLKMILVIFVFFHLLTFNLAQFWLFRKFGFLAMYALRIFYYLFWHILWGHLRLDYLF